MDPRLQPGFLGSASLMADLTLLAYIFILLPAMLVGFVFARRKMFVPHHKLMMTGIVIVNWVLILYLMVYSYSLAVAPNLPDRLGEPFNLLPTLHAITGGVAQLLATYLVLRMWLEKVLPPALMVKNIKRYMRITLSLWIVTVALGVLIYLNWNVSTSVAGDDPTPVATEEAAMTPEPAATDEPTPAATPEAIPDPVATEEA